MRALHERIQQAVGAEHEQLQRQIEKSDREIGDLVYRLYDISEKERAVIEQNQQGLRV